jgi:TolB-like protein
MEINMKKIIIITLILFTISIFGKVNKMTILDFDNNSGIRKYNSLGKGLADMLTTDLTYVKGLKIVEREKLRIIMTEMNLSKSKYINKNNALKLGKGLAADWILKGSFTTVKGRMRIDVNIISTETGEIVESASVEGWVTKFFDLERRLIQKIIKSIHTKENRIVYDSKNDVKEVKDFKTVLEYSKGVKLYDEGKFKESEEAFRKALKFDNNFDYSDKYLKALEERLKKYKEKHDEKENNKLKQILNDYEKNKDKKYDYTEIIQIYSSLMATQKYEKALALLYKFRESLPPNTEYLKYDELVQYYIVTTLEVSKKYDDVLKEGENFLKSFPNSTYFSYVDGIVKRALSYKKDIIISNDKYSTYDEFIKNYKSLKVDQKIYFGKVNKILENLYKDLRYTDYLKLVNFTRTNPPQVSDKKSFDFSMQQIEYMELIVLSILRQYDEYIKRGNLFVEKYPESMQSKSFVKPGIERMTKEKEKSQVKMIEDTKTYKKEKKKKKKNLKKDIKRRESQLKNQIKYSRDFEKTKKLELELKELPLTLEKRMKMDLLDKAVRYRQFEEVASLSKEILEKYKDLTDYEKFEIYENIINNYQNQNKYEETKRYYKKIKKHLDITIYEKKYTKSKKYLKMLKELEDGKFDERIEKLEDDIDEDDLDRNKKDELRKQKRELENTKRELERETKKILDNFNRIKRVIERIGRNVPK